MPNFQEIFQKYFGQSKNNKGLFIILLLGILLLMFSGSIGGAAKKDSPKNIPSQVIQPSAKELEDRLSKILSQMKGVGTVRVMITYDDAGQNVYATDEKIQQAHNEESLKSQKDQVAEDKLVLKNDAGGGQSPVLIKNVYPRISGVLVIAEGAEDFAVKNDMVSAVKAVLDVKSHRVQVFPSG